MQGKATKASSDANAEQQSQSTHADSLKERYRAVRNFSATICEPLVTEDYVIQSMPDVSPTKWHLAHTTWFFETFILKPCCPRYKEFHPRYGYLFNSYYVQVGERHARPRRGLLSRPRVEDVYAYRNHVDGYMAEWLETFAEKQSGTAALVELGLNHEQQHQELIITDIKHVFSCNPLRPAYRKRESRPPIAVPPIRWVQFDGGLHEIGHDGADFAFDNETPRHQTYVPRFKLASRPITNGEYREFIDSGGYERPEIWLSDGWDAVMVQGWSAPLYWERVDGRWYVYTLDGMRELDESEPVCHVSYYEADAYARWAGARLPTEQELEIALRGEKIKGNLAENGNFHPMPADARKGNKAPLQMYGDLWEWTRSPYVPYPGYEPLPGAIGEYNGKFMCNQFVLRGGSCATSRSHIRPTYRNFFYPDARWQFSGIRVAKDVVD
ncbi:MAG: ergothioneine biosynthesis protein EgtB [Acidiferrobacterales bacterium]